MRVGTDNSNIDDIAENPRKQQTNSPKQSSFNGKHRIWQICRKGT